jgi:hypothetical protein
MQSGSRVVVGNGSVPAIENSGPSGGIFSVWRVTHRHALRRGQMQWLYANFYECSRIKGLTVAVCFQRGSEVANRLRRTVLFKTPQAGMRSNDKPDKHCHNQPRITVHLFL